MKNAILTLVMLIMVACGTRQQNNDRITIDKTLPIEHIDKELADMLCDIKKFNTGDDFLISDSLVKTFTERLEYYLRHPQTYENEMPLLKERMGITEYPQTGHKFYDVWFYRGGTMGYTHKNYIQYRNKRGEVEFIPFLNDLRYPESFDFYDFYHNGTAYYLVENFSQGMSCSWYYYIAIISINDGKITYHPEFFPSEFDFKPGIEEYFIYDETGKIIGNDERPSYFMRVCGTENCNTNVGFDFDPKTLTIKVKDDADTSESRTGAVVEREWKLKLSH